MRIAFVGKGGSGKTTATAVFARYLAALGRRVLAVDADINQHLGPALGHDGPAPGQGTAARQDRAVEPPQGAPLPTRARHRQADTASPGAHEHHTGHGHGPAAPADRRARVAIAALWCPARWPT
jgi:hypothetical protein